MMISLYILLGRAQVLNEVEMAEKDDKLEGKIDLPHRLSATPGGVVEEGLVTEEVMSSRSSGREK